MNDKCAKFLPETLSLHAGYDQMRSEGSVVVPMFATSTFAYSSAEAATQSFQKAFAGKKDGELIYGRLNHPNSEILEDRLVCIEPGAGAAAVFNSGLSAISTTLLALCKPGDTIAFSDPVYGGTYHFLTEYLRDNIKINVKAIKTSSYEKMKGILKKIGKKLKIFFIETPANPTLAMTDIDESAKLAKEINPDCTVIIDNTFMGIFQNPFKVSQHVDIVVYSATKFLAGHSNLIAGVVLTKPNNEDLMNKIKTLRLQLGGILPAFESWLFTTQLKTYYLRMREQARIATLLAQRLNRNPKISKIKHPSLLKTNSRAYNIYKKQCTGSSSIITFWLKDADRKKTFKFLNEVKKSNIISLAVSLGGVESLICHPASTTHSEMTPKELENSGISENLVRLSVGLESPEDLIRILEEALDKI